LDVEDLSRLVADMSSPPAALIAPPSGISPG
jgi:hypothetical protein